MSVEQVRFQVGKETLAGCKILGSQGCEEIEKFPSCLFLHGAGRANKERVMPLALELAKHEINSFAFDFSGHGKSTGKLKESSLQRRTKEAQAALKFFPNLENITVIAFSMGGHIALKLLASTPIQNLVLFCPAIYDRAAFNIPFNQNFSEIIRTAESWRNSEALEILETFQGNLLIYIGKRDEVIPKGVIELLQQRSIKTNQKEIVVVPEVTHQIAKWMSENPTELSQIGDRIARLIQSS